MTNNEKIIMIFTTADTENEKFGEILHKLVSKIQEEIPEEYATSSTFSMVSDAIESKRNVFFVRSPPKLSGKYMEM